MYGEADTYPPPRTPARWWRYDITVTSPDGTWHWRENDPVEALAKARAQLFTPAEGDTFDHPGDVSRLHHGAVLRAVCVDGAVIAVTPLLI
jgi:hypothetical protein